MFVCIFVLVITILPVAETLEHLVEELTVYNHANMKDWNLDH
jgi:hypothetical protein